METEIYSSTPTTCQADSLKKRYAYKVLTNGLGLLFSLGAAAMVPRALGPTDFGSFNYVTNFFTQLLSFFDLGSSTYFFTRTSKNNSDYSLIVFFIFWGSLLCGGTVLFSSLSLSPSLSHWIWPDQNSYILVLAALFVCATWVSQRLIDLMDAAAQTVVLEKWRIAQKILSLSVLYILFRLGNLNLESYFYQHLFVILFLCTILLVHLRQTSLNEFRFQVLKIEQFKRLARDIVSYCHPLFFYSLAGLATNLLDRWMLQSYSGSIQQGFFGLSTQISSICFVATGAFTPLLTREYSMAHGKNDHDSLVKMFHSYLPSFFVLTAFLSCFVATEGDDFTFILGGKGFQGASFAVALMALYPITQTYGQLVGSFFLATNRTRLYSNIGIGIQVLGILFTWILFSVIAKFFSGEIGAACLAVKTILIGFISVTLLFWHGCKILKVPFWTNLMHQGRVVTFFLLLGWVISITVRKMVTSTPVWHVLFSGLCYVPLSLLVVVRFPAFMGIPPDFIPNLLRSRLKKGSL